MAMAAIPAIPDQGLKPDSGSLGTLHYRAFISYSHRDAGIARWLHRNLETYRVPSRLRGTSGAFGPLPDRLTPIFRDREDLASAGELDARIQAVLADSEALVVICSPHAARSSWVDSEVLAFKRLGRAHRIFCLIVDGEPGDALNECFPLALRFELDAQGDLGTRRVEPVAADLRPDKDGKALAKLRIISGLLGVDLDALRQREAARRQRRLAAITGVALAVMLVTSFLAVQAVIARHSAERRQQQAEALVDFILGDLNDKLVQVSQLDILEAAHERAMAYFRSLPTDDVTEQALEQRAKALVKIGNVRLDKGNLPQALQSYQAAATLAATLARAAPADTERQSVYADSLAFVGMTHWYQGDLAQAQAGFASAQDVLLQAQTRDPRNPKLLFQLSTIENNIGHVLEAHGQIEEAVTQYQQMLARCEALAAINPDNTKWAQQLGLAHNNLAKMALQQGDLASAVAQYRADVEIEAGLAGKNARDNSQAERLLMSRAALGRTLALTGDIAAGIDNLQQAVIEAKRLGGIDASNASFLEDIGLYSTQLARLRRLGGDLVGARALTTQASGILERLIKQDPANAGWQRELAEIQIEKAEQFRSSGEVHAAREQARSALAILEPQLAKRPEDRATVLTTTSARLLLAAVVADTDIATKLREQALQTLKAQSSGRADPRLRALHVEALSGLSRRAEAEPELVALERSGYRDPALTALLQRESMAKPAARPLTQSGAPSHRP